MNNIFNDADNALHDTMLLELDFLRPHVDAFQEVACKEAIGAHSWAIEDFRKRASVSAFRIAAVCYNLYNISNELLPENERFSQCQIEENTAVIYNYCTYFILTALLDFCGNRYDNIKKEAIAAKDAIEGTSVPFFESLPNSFSRLFLSMEVKKRGFSASDKMFINKWLKQGRIEDLGDGSYRKIKKTTTTT
jgi:hypothetical protein